MYYAVKTKKKKYKMLGTRCKINNGLNYPLPTENIRKLPSPLGGRGAG